MSLSDISKKFTNETLNEIFKKVGGDKVDKWEFVEGENKKGDSYLSDIYRIIISGSTLTGDELSTNVIIKTIPKNIGRKNTFRSSDFFRNEYKFYTKVIPKLEDFQRSQNMTHPFLDYPICLAAYCDGDNDFIALNDFSVEMYSSGNRQIGLDIDHCLLIMKTLGKLHGVSLTLKNQEPDEFMKIAECLEETYYADNLKWWYKDFILKQISVGLDAVHKEYPGSIIEEKFKEFTKGNLYDRMVQLTHTRNKYSVLSHGDCWTPNFLFQYHPDGVLKNVKIIDFQLARYASPALDLSFFIYSCTSQSLRETYYDELLRVYHESLCDIVNKLGSNPEEVFPFSALENEMKVSARFGCGMGIESVPFSVMDDSETADLDTIQGTEAIPITDIWILKNITSKEGRLRVADIFKHAIDKGYLD